MFGLRRDLRFLKAGKAAKDLYDDFDHAAQHPDDYRDQAWWHTVLDAAGRLVKNLPLPQGLVMTSWMQKIGMIAGAAVTVAGALKDTPYIPAQYQPFVAVVGMFAGMLSGLYHPVPVPVATDQPPTK